MRRSLIAVIGDAAITRGTTPWTTCERLGRLLVDEGHRVLTGGLGGVMEAACEGARLSSLYREGDTVGVLPGHDPAAASPGVDIAIATGFDHGRNVIVAQADAVIAVGGGAGTLSEMALAWAHRRLLIGFRGAGWSGRLADERIDDRSRYPSIPEDRVYGVSTAEEAIERLRALLPRYDARHRGVARRE